MKIEKKPKEEFDVVITLSADECKKLSMALREHDVGTRTVGGVNTAREIYYRLGEIL